MSISAPSRSTANRASEPPASGLPTTRTATAEAGERIGGSGFLCIYYEPGAEEEHQVYVVTNAHVIEAGNFAVRINTKAGKHAVLNSTERDWYCHPAGDDVAVWPVKFDLE